jgi:hypothetical protein
MAPQLADPAERSKPASPSLCRKIVVGCISIPPQTSLGPACMRNEMTTLPDTKALCTIAGSLFENRCIHSRCKSILVSLAENCPRRVTVISAVVARADDANSSGSVKV